MRTASCILTLFIIISAAASGLCATPFANNPLQIIKGYTPPPEFSGNAISKKAKGFHLRVAGYNIAHARGAGSGGLKEIGKPSKLRGIAKLVKGNKIDIVAFTEISSGDMRVLFRNQPKYIAKYLGYHYVYKQNYKRGLFGKIATQGNAIVSKYPIVSHKNHKLYRTSRKNEQRACLEVVINLGKPGNIKVLVAHLSLKPEESTKQIKQIWTIVEASKEPVILAGDFNSRPGSMRVKWLEERMKNTTSNLNTTYKNIPNVKIDYHFISGPWSFGVSHVVGFDLDYSDHGCLINDYWLQNDSK